MSPEPNPITVAPPGIVEEALATVRHSHPEDYDGHTEFAGMSPNARLAWLEAAVRFVQSSKAVRRPTTGPLQSDPECRR